ncbi:MAG: hypothetical protein ACP5QA_14855 [Phycisphaerae bacterium]
MKTAPAGKQAQSDNGSPSEFIKAVEDYILSLKQSQAFEAYRHQQKELRLPSPTRSEKEDKALVLSLKADDAAATARAKALSAGRKLSTIPEVASILEFMDGRPNAALLESTWPACRAALTRLEPAANIKLIELDEANKTLMLRIGDEEESITLSGPQFNCVKPLADASPKRIQLSRWQDLSGSEQPYKQLETMAKRHAILRKFYRNPKGVKGCGYALIPPEK